MHPLNDNSVGVFYAGFSLVGFSAVGFLSPIKTFKTQRQKVMFLYKSNFHWQSNAFLWFEFQTCGFTYQGGQCIVAMFSCFKTKSQRKFTTQGLCIRAMSHVELITETRVYMCHKNMKSMRFFYSFLNVIAEHFIKNVLLEMKNGLSLSQQQLQVIMYYIIT